MLEHEATERRSPRTTRSPRRRAGGKEDGRGGWSRASLVAAALLLASGLPAGLCAQTPVTDGYRDFSYGTSGNSTPTGEKPESKLWWNDGAWWGSLYSANARAYHIYRFDTGAQAWTDTGTQIDNRPSTKADVLWDDAASKLYVVSHVFTTTGSASNSSSQWGRLYRFSYAAGQQKYVLDPGFPVTVTKGKSETLTIAQDSVKRLWVTYVESSTVKVNWSRTSDLDWGDPITLPVGSSYTSVKSDDISDIVAFGGAYVGVIWSNQSSDETYFTYRVDTEAPDAWKAVERVLPGNGCSGACSDDHFNVKADSSGRLYVATKTSLTASTAPLAMLSVRSATQPATWTNYQFGTEGNHHTRPIVLLHEEADRLYMFATSGESGGAIYMKSTALDNIDFASGLGEAVIRSASDTTINNVTSTKQNLTAETGLLIAASDQNTHYYLHAYMTLGGSTPAPAAPTGLAASAVSSSRVDLTWTDGSNNEDSFSIERATSGGSFGQIATVSADVTSFSDTAVSPSTSYGYRVRATNAGGNSAYSNTASVTTPAAVVIAPSAPTGLNATAASGTRVDLSWTDTSGNEDGFSIERADGQAAFAVVATVSANVTSYSDTTVAASTSYSYRVRAGNAGGYSDYSNTATVTTPAGAVSSPIKSMTFENGALVDATTGADKVTGGVTLETAAPLKGAYSARIPAVGSAYVEESFSAVDDLYVSFYVRLNALPSSDVRILQVSAAGTTIGNLVLRSTGRLRLRVDATTIGESPVLTVGQVYRVGFRQKQGTGGDGVLEGYVVAGDAQFGAAFASSAAGTWTVGADRARVGATTSAVADVVIDNVLLDAASMPGPTGQ